MSGSVFATASKAFHPTTAERSTRSTIRTSAAAETASLQSADPTHRYRYHTTYLTLGENRLVGAEIQRWENGGLTMPRGWLAVEQTSWVTARGAARTAPPSRPADIGWGPVGE